MINSISFSSSKFKLHDGGMTSSDQIRKKKEKHINQTVNMNNDITVRNNKVVRVGDYGTYFQLTRPKFTAVYNKSVISGHNLYKTVNEIGSIHDRDGCVGACEFGSEDLVNDYLEKSVSTLTNIDMSFNESLNYAENYTPTP